MELVFFYECSEDFLLRYCIDTFKILKPFSRDKIGNDNDHLPIHVRDYGSRCILSDRPWK